jgi:hypothetical protein
MRFAAAWASQVFVGNVWMEWKQGALALSHSATLAPRVFQKSFRHGTFALYLAYVLYLAFEEGPREISYLRALT